MTPDVSEPEKLYFNGINGDIGEYDLPPMTGDELFSFIRGQSPPENLNELRFRFQQATQQHLGVKEGVDPKKLDEAGWGVIFAHDADPAVKEALSELLNLRREQAGDYFKIYDGPNGYRPDEAKGKFLARHGAGPGPADPEKVPYYLLIVGSPEAIPYRFQSQLDVQYAAGRIHFDTLDEYAAYARGVVAAETGAVKLPRQVAFFGVANADDRATQLSATNLVQPIYDGLKTRQPEWEFTTVAPEAATKAQLAHLLGGDRTPALLFTASHGMSFPLGSPRQLPHQGALLCQDWPGPEEWRGRGEIPQSFYFAGDDLSGDANLLGLIAFFFACYGAGTPLEDEFARQAFRDRSAIAPHAFLAQLPVRMLGHPRGGALAAIGHVERAWGYSFLWPGAGRQTETFDSTLRRLLDGHPVGSAIEYFNERYAELSTVLSDELEEIEFGKTADAYDLSGMWTANNDARGYAIVGDPAVRLPVAAPGEESSARPVIEVLPARAATAAATPAPVAKETPIGSPLPLTGAEVADSFDATTTPSPAGLSALQPAAGAQLKTITVTTYRTKGDQAGRTPVATTHLILDGDVETVVAAETAAGDEPLLAMHQALVREAVAARLAYLKLLVD